jgi:hypothetical protein
LQEQGGTGAAGGESVSYRAASRSARFGFGCEGRNHIVLIEAKVGQPSDFIIRQLFYPHRKWKLEIPQKRIRPWFFASSAIAPRREHGNLSHEAENA